jgi:hypothetical protein
MIWIDDDLVKTPKKLSTLGNSKDAIKKRFQFIINCNVGQFCNPHP